MKIKIYNKPQSVRSISKGWSYKKTPKADFIIKLRDKGELLGVCYLKNNFLFGLFVNPKYRNKGYGGILIKTAIKVANKQLSLIPLGNDEKLRKYYEKFGFVGYTGKEVGYEAEDKNWWIMKCIIQK